VPLDLISTAAIEGITDQMCFQAMVDHRANHAIAGGSQHSTISAMSHHCRFLIVGYAKHRGDILIGAASVSICRPFAARVARSACGAAKAPAFRFRSSTSGGWGFILITAPPEHR
jgi:hypothetical protein